MRKKNATLTFISILILPVLLSSVSAAQAPSQRETVFSFHMSNEPASLDPAKMTSADASYFFFNLMRGLYTYSNEKGLQPEGAEKCVFVNPLKLVCDLSKTAKWSDGSLVVAEDYVRSIRRLLRPTSRNPSIELLQNLKFAVAAHAGDKPIEQIGVSAPQATRLVFEFSQPDPDFIFKLTSSILVPVKLDEFPTREKSASVVVNGPYKIKSWTPGRRVRWEANPFYKTGFAARPNVEVLFVDEDRTAQSLYEKGELTFLRRLPTGEINHFKGRPDFLQLPVARFDYLGFGDDLKDLPDVRAALSLSLDFKELAKVLDALGRPGCPSLPPQLVDRERCVDFDLAKAKSYWEKVPADFKKRRLRFAFSASGGDDIKKAAEWFQGQWKKNLGLTVDLEQTENSVYLALLRTKPTPIFRKGVPLDRPTCLAALETFAKGGAENFLKLEESAFEAIIARLQKSPGPAASKKICGDGVQYLLDQRKLIPLGRIHFTMLVKPEYKGWRFNEMNQLDLSQLYFEASSPEAKK